MKVINTLTGFKWIAAKIKAYEDGLKAALLASEGVAIDYDATPFESRARLLFKHSPFYLFGAEESYGYLPNDLVRDKLNRWFFNDTAVRTLLPKIEAEVLAGRLTVTSAVSTLFNAFEGAGHINEKGVTS